MPSREHRVWRENNKRVTRQERHRWRVWMQNHPEASQMTGARHFGANYNTFVLNLRKARQEHEEAESSKDTLSKSQASPPVPPEDWSDEVKAVMADTLEADEAFLLRYFLPYEAGFEKACPDGRLPEWQRELIRQVRLAKQAGVLRLDEPRWTEVTVHPGSGKSTIVVGLIIKWIAADRNVRGFYVTLSQDLAVDRMEQIKWHLTENALLLQDFGSFKPDAGQPWTRTKIVVRGQKVAGVATLRVFGAGQRIYGTRPHFIVGDDVVDFLTRLDPKEADKTNRWWEGQVMTRLTDDGWGVNIGSRMGPGDLHSYCGEMETTDGRKVFRWVRFKAHDTAKCPVFNKTGATHTAYPDGCLLNPSLLPLHLLNNGIHNSPVWATAYQQEEVATDEVLVQPAWIYGGADNDGVQWPGCLDRLRDVREFPTGDGVCVLTCDPSPTQYWSLQWWFVQHPEAPVWHLIDHWRGKGSPNNLLDFVGTMPTGMLVEWESFARASGQPIRYLIVEQNAAQRWLFQSHMAQKWLKEQGIKGIPHHTHENKGDATLGVWGLSKRYASGSIRLPFASRPTKDKVQPIIDEATRYPFLKTDDTVMSSWFLLHNEKKVRPRTLLSSDFVLHLDGIDMSREITLTSVN